MKSGPKLIFTFTLLDAGEPSGLNTMPVRRPLISRVAGNCKTLFVEFGSVEVVCPLVLITTGKNGDAACNPNGPTRMPFGKVNVPRAGSLFTSPRMTNDGAPFASGPMPVSRTFAPMGTP